VAIWSGPPEETGLVRELEALWHSIDGPIEQRNAAVRAHPRAAEVESLTAMDDPAMTVLGALCLRWSEGRKPFARNRECLRTSHGERTFDLDKFLLCKLGPQVERADGGKSPLALMDVRIWLDPRFSKDDKKNDFAAVVAVGRDKEGRMYTLDADLKRDRGSASRARVWSMLDRLLGLGADPRRVVIGYETNGGAEGTYEETFDEDVSARRKAGKFAPTIEGRHSSGAKLDRIETMEDALHGGRWQIASHLVRSELWGQIEAVPHGQHDDGPDAMERAGAMLSAPPRPTSIFDLRAR
jgi:phage terminase large subunit-like protein